MVLAVDALIATRATLEPVVRSLKPLTGSYWLAMDRTTRCHWVVEAATVQTVRSSRYASTTVVSNLVAINSRAGTSVFMIEEHDALSWLISGETLVIQEGRLRGSETVLQRLDDIDAPTMSRESLDRQLAACEIVPAIRIRDDRYVEVAACLLPTGDIGVDNELAEIEATIRTRLALRGPGTGTDEVLRDLDRRLGALAGSNGLDSYIWLISLRELIQRLLRPSRT